GAAVPGRGELALRAVQLAVELRFHRVDHGVRAAVVAGVGLRVGALELALELVEALGLAPAAVILLRVAARARRAGRGDRLQLLAVALARGRADPGGCGERRERERGTNRDGEKPLPHGVLQDREPLRAARGRIVSSAGAARRWIVDRASGRPAARLA